jgi:DNA polymerase III subunit beta
MQFTINREALLKPLQLVTAVIERRQTLPILSNVFLDLKAKELFLLGTDMEVELSGRVNLEKTGIDGKITAPARKLVDICRSLPEGSDLKFQHKDNKLLVQCGRSRFNLATLPSTDFPIAETLSSSSFEPLEFVLSQQHLRSLIESTNFAMAQQDVRYYLNGMLWELGQGRLQAVATDGHRLALSIKDANVTGKNQIIVPRKAIYELSRLLSDVEEEATILLNNNQLRVTLRDYTFTSKLIDGKFPDYDRVIPKGGDKILMVDRDLFKSSLTRVGILSNDKHKSVCLEMRDNTLRIFANNLDQEEAEDHLDIIYTGEAITIALNINYLIDVLNSLPSGLVKITLTSMDASVRLESAEENSGIYVIMPMRL